MRYRPDIDGLRCIAVLLVVAFHVSPDFVHGGFVGVDIFFVISGCLITSIVLDRETFSYTEFYFRRIRRIFPALITVLITSILIGYSLLSTFDFVQLGKFTIASAAFAANIFLWMHSGYFDTASVRNPLLHLWSLGVEEQFYIVWPALLIFFVRRGASASITIAWVFLSSFVFNIFWIVGHPISTFYLPFTRIWELSAGGLLSSITIDNSGRVITYLKSNASKALWFLKIAVGDRWVTLILHNSLSVIGCSLIIVAVLTVNSTVAFPGFRGLLPVGGAFLILVARKAWINRRVLASGPMVAIGLISYPLYLWHWPLLVFARAYKEEPLSWQESCAIVVASFLLAWFTYFYIEKYFRYGELRQWKSMAACLAMGTTAIAGFSAAVPHRVEYSTPVLVRDVVKATNDAVPELIRTWRIHKCFQDQEDKLKFAAECDGGGRRPLFVLWGDSFAAAAYPGIKHISDLHGFSVAQFTNSGCPPWIGYENAGRPFCKANNDFTVAKIHELIPDILLLHSASGLPSPYLEKVAAEFPEVKRIILLGQIPTWKDPGGAENIVEYFKLRHEILPRRTSFRLVPYADRDAIVRVETEANHIEYISAWKVFCDPDGCLNRAGDGPEDSFYWSSHLTLLGSNFLAKGIEADIFGKPTQKARSP
jgi:peptidoglycan/LPS O-acetylase OafA/YrhL